jgi:hypothetical protein
MMKIPGISEISYGLANGDDLMERLSRYEQRLELSIHRSLRQLEKIRRNRNHSEPEAESTEQPARPEVAEKTACEAIEKTHQIERNEPKRSVEEKPQNRSGIVAVRTRRQTHETDGESPSSGRRETASLGNPSQSG